MKQTLQGLVVLSLTLTLSAFAGGRPGVNGSFPQGPDPRITPGSTCATPTEYRYPEHVPYCKRNVEGSEKAHIIETYDTQLGFSIRTMNRQDFKIDHLIPLCAGGSNENTNLWPQHKSVYEKTDPIEPLICELMSKGKLSQDEAVKIIVEAKHNLDTVGEVLAGLNSKR